MKPPAQLTTNLQSSKNLRQLYRTSARTAHRGSKLAAIRKAKCITQAQLAAMIGTRKQAVSQWESGIFMPNSNHLLSLAHALSCAPADLFDTPCREKNYRGLAGYVCKGYHFRIAPDLHPETRQRLYEVVDLKPANVPPYLCTLRECRAYIMKHQKRIDPEKLKAARKACGYTQRQLAKMLFISIALLSQWERGLFNPSGEMLLMLADALRCSVDDLIRQEK